MERCRGLVIFATCLVASPMLLFFWILTMTMTFGPSFSRALHFATMTRYWSIHAELSCHLFAPSTNFPPFRTTPSRHFRTPFLLSFLDSIVDDDRRPSTTDLLQLIWKILANRFYMTGVSRLHAVDSRLHALISKPNAKFYATYPHFLAKYCLDSSFCFGQIM